MSTTRRRRFIEWFAATYGEGERARARFMKDTGFSKGRVSQLFAEQYPFGETACRNLAERLRLPPTFFLDPLAISSGAGAEPIADDLRAISELAPDQFKTLCREVARMAEGVRAAERIRKQIEAETNRPAAPRAGRGQAPAGLLHGGLAALSGGDKKRAPAKGAKTPPTKQGTK